MQNTLYGLAVCGGSSTRMGTDKSLLDYHGKPQRYFVYEILENVCEKVFISCNQLQISTISEQYNTLIDLPAYSKTGPMAALLTAFTAYPTYDFLIIGCDYPFVTTKELKEFLGSIEKEKEAAAFYNREHSMYEPLLAWYSQKAAIKIQGMLKKKQYSLQQFLKENNAGKYESGNPESIISVDTPENYQRIKEVLNRNNLFK